MQLEFGMTEEDIKKAKMEEKWKKEKVSATKKYNALGYDQKDVFIGMDKKAIQVFPAESEHVNIMPYCLHLWCNLDRDVLPDFTMGGGSIMCITKTFINKAMRTRGRIDKRNKTEIVCQIKYLADKYGRDASDTVKTILWCLGYSQSDSEEIALEITTFKKQMSLHGERRI